MISWRPSESFWTIAEDGTITVSLGNVINWSKGEAELARTFNSSGEITLPVNFFVEYLLDDQRLSPLEKKRALIATRSALYINSIEELPEELTEREKMILISIHAQGVRQFGPGHTHWDFARSSGHLF